MSIIEQKLSKSGQVHATLPEQLEIYKNLYILFKGDYNKMEWFYENRTYADLVLMICVHNVTSDFSS